MKINLKAFVILVHLLTAALPLSAQNFQEWWQQKKTQKQYLAEEIVAFQAYRTVLKEGYEVAHQGLGLIHTIKNGDFYQHQDHFQSFSNVSPEIKNHPDTRQIIALASRIQQLSSQTQQQIISSKQLTGSERAVVSHVFSNIQKECIVLLDELQQLLQNDALSLSDPERMEWISRLLDQLQQTHGYASQFGQEALQLAIYRKQESGTLTQSRIRHDLDQP